MQPAPIPLDEARRVSAVRSLALLDTPAEERYDRLTRIAIRLFGVRAATISVVDEAREWVKSACGFPYEQLARQSSFGAYAIGSGDLFVVTDASADPRFKDHPLVTEGPRFRFYAGQPLHSSDGSQPAVLSLYGEVPRELSMADRSALADLAGVAERELRATELSGPQLEAAGRATRTESQRVDPLTRLWNRATMFEIVRRELDVARADRLPVAFMIIEVSPVGGAVLPSGQPAADWALSEVARGLRSSLRPYDVIARFTGQEFAALLTSVDSRSAVDAAERVRAVVARDLRAGLGREVTVTAGLVATPAQAAEPESLVRAAQAALWNAKSHGGNTVGISQLPAGGQ
jgi:diguanylate cyclase (GGDEF)-like protein